MLSTEELDHGSVGDVTGIDDGYPEMTQCDRIDATSHQSALQRCVVLGKVRWTQYGGGQLSLLDHAFGRELRVEVGYVAEVTAAIDGHVNDPRHPRLSCQAQRK